MISCQDVLWGSAGGDPRYQEVQEEEEAVGAGIYHDSSCQPPLNGHCAAPKILS